MFAVVNYWANDSLEIIYVAIFMIGMLAAILLGRWTIKRLLIFMFVVATLLVTAKAAHEIIHHIYNSTGGYTVQVPV